MGDPASLPDASTEGAVGAAGETVPAVFLAAPPDMQRDLAAVDWAATPLGHPDSWPTSLANVVRLQLSSRFPMWMAWGPELTFLCNDAYRRDTLGSKYPWALGKPTEQVWSEIWPDVRPRIDSVIKTGASTWDEGLMLILERSGYQEETYHTFSYSPITDDNAQIAGLLCVVTEETGRIIAERRMATARDLGTALAAATTVEEASVAIGTQLASNPWTMPFALGYLFNTEDGTAELAWTAGCRPDDEVAPLVLELEADHVWPLARVQAGEEHLVPDLEERFTEIPRGVWDIAPSRALLLPLTAAKGERIVGCMVVGLNPYRALDHVYRGFLELLTGQISTAIIRGLEHAEERRRAEGLAALDRAKTTFFTNVSHELRTPLTLLLGPAADALEDQNEPLGDKQRDRVEVIERNAERLLKLVNTLLDLSRLEATETQARFEPLDLARYTKELTGLFESAITRAGLGFEVAVQPLGQRVHVDREMWAKIVLNLVSNALKATFTGSISVQLAEDENGALLSVTDTGIGIPESEQERLFERFHRVSGAALRSHEGSGIGLALVSELARLHGGGVVLQSTPDVGSTFTVSIPYGTSHLPQDQVVMEELEASTPASRYGAGYLAEASRWLDGNDAPVAEPRPESAKPRILVVDDNADMRDYVSGLLVDDYVVVTAVDGVDALECAADDDFDLVLTDVMMPRLDGFGLLKRLREDSRTLHIPVVMLSARSGDDATVEGLEAGADDYLIKPFASRELLARVKSNLELDKARRVADELSRSRELLDSAEELAHVGSWEIDLETGALIGSHEFFRISGALTGQEHGVLSIDQVVDEDRDRVIEALTRSRDERIPLDIEATLNVGEGQRRLIRLQALVHDRAGERAVLRGSIQDITEQRLAEQSMARETAARESAAREHAIAEELQRSILAAPNPTAEHLDIATYYRAGVAGTQAGGDWYDVIDLGSGRTALIIGDVMGRGVRAAATMGQLRAATRAYARLELPPGDLLALLDEAVQEIRSTTIVTCVYAVHDSVSQTLTYGNAGHLPPLLIRPDGTVERLVSGDPPLGTGAYAGHVEKLCFPVGSRLALYTDGLVEHRGRDIDEDIDRLAGLLGDLSRPIESLPGLVVDTLLPQGPEDDVAVLVTASIDPTVRQRLVVPVIYDERRIKEVRHIAEQSMMDWGIPGELGFEMLLVISELVTNSVRYAKPPIELKLRKGRRHLVVEISDGEAMIPQERELSAEAEGGRGLHIIASLAEHWGTRPTGAGKSVWAALRLPDASSPDRSSAHLHAF